MRDIGSFVRRSDCQTIAVLVISVRTLNLIETSPGRPRSGPTHRPAARWDRLANDDPHPDRSRSDQPRPTKGILVAMTVRKRTFASSGRLAMYRTALATCPTSI